MNEAEQILVIFLSSALAVFLVLGIIALALIIKILKSIRHISDKAEAVSDIIEESARSISNIKIVSSVVGAINNLTHSKRGKDNE